MFPGAHAETTPDAPAVILAGSGQVITYRELDAEANRVSHVFRSLGLQPGDHVALCLENHPRYFALVWGAHYAGLCYTAMSSRLTTDEMAYIIEDCGARAFVTSAYKADQAAELTPRLGGDVALYMMDGTVEGYASWEEALAAQPATPLPEDRVEGRDMLYSSGTTGRPKGILPPLAEGDLGAPSFLTRLLTGLFGFTADTVYLSPAPLYHAAPAGWTTGTQRLGGTAVVMERFDPLELLAAIERYRVTHVQLVPTHMIRLLKLSAEERARHDLSSLRMVVHAAAPCPVEVKRATLDWLGPIVHEFYSGSEGAGFCYIGPEDWLAHPGSVGRSMTGAIHIVGEGREELPVGEEGEIWFETTRRFEYHRDPDKTKAAWDPRGWSWLGDVGRVDADGYLYLTDRASHMIISGGVNICPREVEDVLVVHPAVADVAVVGTPDPDMGEQVTAFVQRAEGATMDEAELIAWCRDRLSHFKCPRSVRFVAELPRLPTGKLLKRLLVTAPGA